MAKRSLALDMVACLYLMQWPLNQCVLQCLSPCIHECRKLDAPSDFFLFIFKIARCFPHWFLGASSSGIEWSYAKWWTLCFFPIFPLLLPSQHRSFVISAMTYCESCVSFQMTYQHKVLREKGRFLDNWPRMWMWCEGEERKIICYVIVLKEIVVCVCVCFLPN